MAYWEGSPERWALINHVQQLKEVYGFARQKAIDVNRSDRYVMTNPVTGAEVPMADLKYAASHLAHIYESGMIREDRWAFLWYH